MSDEKKVAYVWMPPTKSSPICRYSYDPLRGKTKGQLTQGRPIHSDCGMWLTFFDKSLVIEEKDVMDICPFCAAGVRVATPAPVAVKPRRQGGLIHYLRHDA